jgi:hypothetical protein
VSPDHAAALRLIGEARARLDAAEALLLGVEPPRPSAPTRAWCLLPPNRVRWLREPVTLTARRWALLGALLDLSPARRPVEVSDLESLCGDMTDGALRAGLCRLNADLQAVGWPVVYAVENGFVVTS